MDYPDVAKARQPHFSTSASFDYLQCQHLFLFKRCKHPVVSAAFQWCEHVFGSFQVRNVTTQWMDGLIMVAPVLRNDSTHEPWCVGWRTTHLSTWFVVISWYFDLNLFAILVYSLVLRHFEWIEDSNAQWHWTSVRQICVRCISTERLHKNCWRLRAFRCLGFCRLKLLWRLWSQK